MLKIDNIEEFIKFLLDLFNDEFNYVIDYIDAYQYFMFGGCAELAQVVHYFFPDTKFALKKDNSHIGILSDRKIYDALSVYDKEEIDKMELPFWALDKNLDHFEFFDSYEELLRNTSVSFGRSIMINGKTIDELLIDEINDIDSVKVGKIYKIVN